MERRGGVRIPGPGKKLGPPKQMPDDLKEQLILEFKIALRRVAHAGVGRQPGMANHARFAIRIFPNATNRKAE